MLELTAGDASLTVDAVDGGRILSLRVGDLDLLLTRADDPGGTGHFGAFVMAPWAGRLRHGRFTFAGVRHQLPCNAGAHAIHGTVRTRAWTVEHAGLSSATLTCDLGADWPFPGSIEHAIALYDDRVELELTVRAIDAAMPAGCGWHPWWRRTMPNGAAARIDLRADAMYRRDDEGIATAELLRPPPPGPWDDCFTDLGDPIAVLEWPDTAVLTVATDCPDVVVYDQPRDAICVEPQSGPPDALNLRPRVVESGHPLAVRTEWRWRMR